MRNINKKEKIQCNYGIKTLLIKKYRKFVMPDYKLEKKPLYRMLKVFMLLTGIYVFTRPDYKLGNKPLHRMLKVFLFFTGICVFAWLVFVIWLLVNGLKSLNEVVVLTIILVFPWGFVIFHALFYLYAIDYITSKRFSSNKKKKKNNRH